MTQSSGGAFDERPVEPAVGQIQIGNFSENFQMDVSFWNEEEYRSSWVRSLKELERAKECTSCLVTSITDPESANFISCWPLYRDGHAVLVQNSIIFLDELQEHFMPDEPWKSIHPHTSVDEDGNRLSEWATTMTAVREFLAHTETS